MNHLSNTKILLILVGLLSVTLLFPKDVFSQGTGSITGTIFDGNTNLTLPGATITIAGTTEGTSSDVDGRFILSNLPSGTINLEISFVGYLTKQRSIELGEGETKNINVVMVPDLLIMDEVVVIGYGTMRRSDLTGSVVSVTSEDLNRFPSANAIEMLRARLRVFMCEPGMQLLEVAQPSE